MGPLTDHDRTHCLAEHLTEFGSSFTFLPEPIDWNGLLVKSDFVHNRTIYLTVIMVFVLYVTSLIYSRYSDRKDQQQVCLMRRQSEKKRDGWMTDIALCL